MPDGNGSCSWLIICRFIGIARKTPIAPVSSVNRTTTHHGCRKVQSISSSAPKHVEFVEPVEAPAADAVDCMQLFSRIDIGVRAPPVIPRSAFQITYDSTHDVIATPNDQP